MIASLLVLACPLVLVIAATYLVPSLGDPTLAFGVRVPASRRSEPVIGAWERRYRVSMLATGVVLLVAGVAAAAMTDWPVLLAAVVVQLAACVLVYTRATAAIRAVKDHDGWLTGLRQGVSVDTSLRTDPPQFPWVWALPAVLVVAATVLTGVRRYPDLPETLPMHYGLDGTVDRYTGTSVWSAFGLVILQALLTVGLVAMTVVTFHARADLDPEQPELSSRLHRDSQRVLARALLILTACVDVSILFAALMVWSTPPAPVALGVGAVLPVLVGLVVVIAGLAGRRRAAVAAMTGATPTGTGLTHRDDDRSRRLFYADRNDPAILVPKRFGVGYTLNFGRPASWVVMAGLLMLPVVLILLTR